MTSSLTLSWFVFIKLQVCHTQSCRLHTAQLQEGPGHSYQSRQLSQAGELGIQLTSPVQRADSPAPATDWPLLCVLSFLLCVCPADTRMSVPGLHFCSVSVLQTHTCLLLGCLLCSLGQQAVAFVFMLMCYFPVQMKCIKWFDSTPVSYC